MENKEKGHKLNIRSKHPVLIVFLLLIFAVAGITYLLCSSQYDVRKQKILTSYEESFNNRIHAATESVNLWTEDLIAQARRITHSAQYSFFVSNAELIGTDRVASLTSQEQQDESGGVGSETSDDVSMLIQELPFIRDLLLDFMNYSGMQDARLLSSEGLTLLSATLRPIPLTETQRTIAKESLRRNETVFAPIRGSLGGLVLDFADPVRPDDGSDQNARPNAALLLTTSATGKLAQILASEPGQNQNIVVQLIQEQGAGMEEVQLASAKPVPLPADIRLSGTRLPFEKISPKDSNAFYAAAQKIDGLDWWIMVQIPESYINEELQSMAKVVYGFGILGSVGFILLVAFLWWYIDGRQQRMIAGEFKELYMVIKQQKYLLDCVNISLDVGIFMTDQHGTIKICNKAFADTLHEDELSLIETPLSNLFNTENVGTLLQAMQDSQKSEDGKTIELSLQHGEETRLLRITLFPLIDKEMKTDEEGIVGIAGTLQDITAFRQRSIKQQQQQKNTMTAFVRAIEGVDPYLSGHSRLMREIADAMIVTLNLDEKDCQTIQIAADLSQVGKLFVPRELFAKSGDLTEDEYHIMREIPDHAYQILKNINFDLPVAEAVYSMYEKPDGSGYPRGLSGNEISIHARVLTVLNSFCAMISPRSYRDDISSDVAINILRRGSHTFDPLIVETLDNIITTPEGLAILHAHKLATKEEQ